jgi:hypothetical protein
MPLAPCSKSCGFPFPDRSPSWWPLLLSRLLAPPSPSPKTPELSGPLMRFWSLQRVKLQEATATQHAKFPSMPATRRAYLARLRYAYRFFQPLDVLFLSKPSQPYFVLVALMGFHLRRIPLASSCADVSACAFLICRPLCRFVFGCYTSDSGTGI